MIATNTQSCSGIAGFDGLGGILNQWNTELEWLASFMTGSATMAQVCVIDACRLAEMQSHGPDDLLLERARHGTIRTAIEIQRVRIAELASIYERRICPHFDHTALAPELLELVVAEDDLLVSKLDVLCRCALVICGIDKRPLQEAALLLGVSKSSVRAAYCAALQHLDVISCERFRECAAVCN